MHDLAGQNQRINQIQAVEFLDAVYKKCDRLVVVRGSEFEKKSFALYKYTGPRERLISQTYHGRFRTNLNKVRIVEPSELTPLADELAAQVKVDDRYLLQAHLAVNAEVIVTSDQTLGDVAVQHGITCMLRNDFVPDYIARYGV
jgi:hypothetical protein